MKCILCKSKMQSLSVIGCLFFPLNFPLSSLKVISLSSFTSGIPLTLFVNLEFPYDNCSQFLVCLGPNKKKIWALRKNKNKIKCSSVQFPLIWFLLPLEKGNIHMSASRQDEGIHEQWWWSGWQMKQLHSQIESSLKKTQSSLNTSVQSSYHTIWISLFQYPSN